MPLFMEVHTIGGGISTADVLKGLEADLTAQGRVGVSYLRYWVSETAGKVFCLVEADDLDLARTTHRELRGLVADETYSVSEHTWHRPNPS